MLCVHLFFDAIDLDSGKLQLDAVQLMSVLSKKYALINVFKELSSDKVTIIVFHGYREVVSPGAEAVTLIR